MAIRPRPPRAWVLLRDRLGGNVLEPTEDQRAAALRELFGAAKDDGRDECSLEYSRDGGPVILVALTRGRVARLEAWSYPKDSVETVLTRVREATRVTDGEAQALWAHLAAGDLGAVGRFRWS